jgi:hypothetical protein
MKPDDLFKNSIKLIGIIVIFYTVMKSINSIRGPGYSGLNNATVVYLISMLIFGLYLLKNNNLFFRIGIKTTNLFENKYTIKNIILICLKLIGIVLITMQLNSILDFAQFYISTDSVELDLFIWPTTISILLLLLGWVLLILRPIRNNNGEK